MKRLLLTLVCALFTAAALPSMVLSIRQQARARMAQPDQLDGWSVAVPTSMVLTTGPAGTAGWGRWSGPRSASSAASPP